MMAALVVSMIGSGSVGWQRDWIVGEGRSGAWRECRSQESWKALILRSRAPLVDLLSFTTCFSGLVTGRPVSSPPGAEHSPIPLQGEAGDMMLVLVLWSCSASHRGGSLYQGVVDQNWILAKVSCNQPRWL
jgi:hypothetical protein